MLKIFTPCTYGSANENSFRDIIYIFDVDSIWVYKICGGQARGVSLILYVGLGGCTH